MNVTKRSRPKPAEQIYAKHTLVVRMLHWLNFAVIAVLVWTAFLLLSGSPELPWSHWLSPGFYSALRLDHRNDEGRVWHVLFSFIMIAIGVVYAAYLGVSGKWKTILPSVASWKDAYLVILHDIGLKPHQATHVKYNGAQRIAYTAVILMGLGEVVTGLPIYFRGWTAYANALGGETAIRFEHFILMLGILAFFAVHIIQVARAGWNNFRAMVIGLEVVHAGVGRRPSVVQALAEPEHTTVPEPGANVERGIRARSRRGFAIAALAGAVIIAIGAFAHGQSNVPNRVPVWLRWARDTDSKNARERPRGKDAGLQRAPAARRG